MQIFGVSKKKTICKIWVFNNDKVAFGDVHLTYQIFLVLLNNINATFRQSSFRPTLDLVTVWCISSVNHESLRFHTSNCIQWLLLPHMGLFGDILCSFCVLVTGWLIRSNPLQTKLNSAKNQICTHIAFLFLHMHLLSVHKRCF